MCFYRGRGQVKEDDEEKWQFTEHFIYFVEAVTLRYIVIVLLQIIKY